MKETKNKYENSLFHYTNADGLKGTLDTNSLWATATYCLNDQSEIKYSLSILDMTADDDFLKHWKENHIAAINKRKCSDEFIKTLSNELDCLKHFITSFSIINDDETYKHGLLSQWRGYGNDGGYAIEFNKKKLITSFESLDIGLNNKAQLWGEVNYLGPKNESLKDFFKTNIKTVMNDLEIDLNNKFITNSFEIILFEQTLAYLISIAPFTKNPHFSEEKEFRFYIGTYDDLCCDFTNRNGLIIPYKKLDFDIISCINRIIIGPSSRSDDRVRSVKALLKSCIDKHNLKNIDIDVTASNIPFNRE
jgi:hypothetical protein